MAFTRFKYILSNKKETYYGNITTNKKKNRY